MTDIVTLKSAFAAANTYNDWSTAVVVAGLIIEFLALLLFSKAMPKGEKALLIVGSIFVAAGVGGEYVFSGRAASAAIGIQQASDERIASLGREQAADHKVATQAAAYAATLGVSVGSLRGFVSDQIKNNKIAVDELKRDTAGLQQARADAQGAAQDAKKDLADMATALNEERQVRDKFAKLTEDRKIAGTALTTISAAVAQFPGQMWTVTTYWDSREPLAFANEIYAVLDHAKWKYDNSGSKGMLLGGIQGVLIYVHPKASERTKSAAGALAKALSDADIEASVRSMNDPNDTEKEHDRLALTVGAKN